MSNAATTTKPRLRTYSSGQTEVFFADGRSALLIPQGGDEYGGLVKSAEGEELGQVRAFTLPHAVRAAATTGLETPRPLPVDVDEVAAAADDLDSAAKLLRKLLKKRTGRTWSVKRGRGTAYCWLTVTAPPRRLDQYGSLNLDDHMALAAVFGRDCSHQGVSISPTTRVYHCCKAAGVELPE